PRDFALTLEPFAVTARARRALYRFAAFDQGFASGNAAGRHVGDESGMRVADFGAERIFGNLKDALANRLGAAIGMQLTMPAGGGDESLRRGSGLDDLHPHRWLQRGEVCGSRPNVLLRGRLRNRAHARVVL